MVNGGFPFGIVPSINKKDLSALGNRSHDRIDEIRDNFIDHDVRTELALVLVGLQAGEAPDGSGILADGEIEAELVFLLELAGTDLVSPGAGLEGNPGLETAVIGQSDQDGRVKAKGAGMGQIEEGGKGGVPVEGLGEDLVVIALVVKIHAEQDIEGIDVQIADPQGKGDQFQNEPVLLVGSLQGRRVDESAADAVSFDGDPAIRAGFAVFIQTEIAGFPLIEGIHAGKLPLNPLEKMQYGIPFGWQFQLGIKVHIGIKVIT